MTGGPVLRAAAAGAARRLVPTLVVFVVVAAAAATAVLGLAMATSSTLAYHIAREKRHSPDLTVTVDMANVTSAQLAATRRLPGVTEAVGFPATTITISVPVPADMNGGRGPVSGPVTVVGRASRSGPLDDIRQVAGGRWPARLGEIDLAPYASARGSIGQVVTVTVTSLSGKPKLTVVGYASPPTSGDLTQQAWVIPAQLTALEKAGAPEQEEMAYTFRAAASYRRIGVLKSIGFTPAQVAVTYLAQLGIPALAGTVAGTLLGNLWARPMVKVNVPHWIWLSVPIGLCALAGLAALAPAARAGRLSAIQAITAGQAPRARRGHAANRLTARLTLPRPVSLGLAAPLSRPSRLAATLAVITAGLAAVVIAVGLQAQMHQIVMVPGWADNGVKLVRQLTQLVAVLAGLGVFSAVLMLARERVHDLGIFKAVGMTPRQVIIMVTCWVIAPAAAAAVIALPAGIALEHAVARAVVSWQTSRMAQNSSPLGTGGAPSRHQAARPGQPGPVAGHTEIFLPDGHHRIIDIPGHGAPGRGARGSLPPQLARLGTHLTQAYTPGALALLVLAGLAIAIAGALGPAIWAAATRTTSALRAE